MQTRVEEIIDYRASLPFLGIHLSCVFAFWTGISRVAAAICLGMYAVRMFAITAGYHRYFSHRSYKTGRTFQFVLALLGSMAAQKGPLWWASHHRRHHAHSDTAADIHSPVVRGFWWSHAGWFLCRKYDKTDILVVKDLTEYRELRFLNTFYWLPPTALAVIMFGLGRLLQVMSPGTATSAAQMLVWGFLISTVLVYHGTFVVNSVTHVFGARRFATRDDSRNNLLVALITFGEGWHNNHHYAPSSERQGFYWWEIDLSHCILTTLSRCGVVWDLQAPPQRAYEMPVV